MNIVSLLKIFLLSTLPIFESRASIPIGIATYNVHPIPTLLAATLGSVVPMFFLYWTIPKVIQHYKKIGHETSLQKSSTARFATLCIRWYFQRVEQKYKKAIRKWGLMAIAIFIAIPLPGTGVWSGTLAAALLLLPMKKTAPYILLGAAISGTLVTFLTLGFMQR